MANVTEISRTLQILSGETAPLLARQSGLVERSSKLSGSLLLIMVVIGYWQNPLASYQYLAQVGFDLGLEISRQAVWERLNKPACLVYFRGLYEQAQKQLVAKLGLIPDWLKEFEGIYLHDSTHLNLPDSCKEQYPSIAQQSQTRGAKAALKLQTSWNWLTHQFSQLAEQAAKDNDLSFKWASPTFSAGSLVIFDLGYFVLAHLAKFNQAGVWWLTRLDLKCQLYRPTETAVFDLLTYLQNSGLEEVDLTLLVSTKNRFPARVVAVRLPDQVVEQRRRQANQQAKKKGKPLSDNRKAWMDWQVYLTNLPPERATVRQVVLLYRLRWQIELVFKLAKSQAGLELFGKGQKTALLVELYAKLIALTIFYYLITPYRLLERQGVIRELSLTKAWQTLHRLLPDFGRAWRGLSDFANLLKSLGSRWERFCLTDQRRARLSSFQQLERLELYYQTRRLP